MLVRDLCIDRPVDVDESTGRLVTLTTFDAR